MLEPVASGENNIPAVIPEMPFRKVQFGRVYDKLTPNSVIDITVMGHAKLVIDEENLGLEKVSRVSLNKQWESQKDAWTKQCKELGIVIDPFEVFTYYLIQEKAFAILGLPDATKKTARDNMYKMHSEDGEPVKLSAMKGMAICSEYATLETYIAQKIGEPAHLIL